MEVEGRFRVIASLCSGFSSSRVRGFVRVTRHSVGAVSRRRNAYTGANSRGLMPTRSRPEKSGRGS